MAARADPVYARAMAATPGSEPRAHQAPSPANFGAGRLFLADSRLAFSVLNHVRYLTLRRAFGVSREQANLLTFVLLVGAADGAYVTARHVMRAPLRVTGTDAAMGGMVLRESMFGLAGPASRETPLFGTLLAAALLAGVARPGLRRAFSNARATERRIRQARIRKYIGGA